MEELSFEYRSHEELWELLDRKADHILIHRFNPNPSMEWWNTSLRVEEGYLMEDAKVRNMEFDLLCGPYALKRILELHTPQLRIYQFRKAVPDTLVIEHLPEDQEEEILRQNGLEHFIWINSEFVRIRSFDVAYLQRLRERLGSRLLPNSG